MRFGEPLLRDWSVISRGKAADIVARTLQEQADAHRRDLRSIRCPVRAAASASCLAADAQRQIDGSDEGGMAQMAAFFSFITILLALQLVFLLWNRLYYRELGGRKRDCPIQVR